MQTEIKWIMMIKIKIWIHIHVTHGTMMQIHIVHIYFAVAAVTAEPHYIEIVTYITCPANYY